MELAERRGFSLCSSSRYVNGKRKHAHGMPEGVRSKQIAFVEQGK